MTIFLVTNGQYDDREVVGVFSSKVEAEAYLNEDQLDQLRAENPKAMPVTDSGTWLHDYGKWDYYEIQEIEVDSLQPLKWECWPNPYPQTRKSASHFIGTMAAHAENGDEEEVTQDGAVVETQTTQNLC